MRIVFLIAAAIVSGCAQVPKESVTLSDTVGRDVSAIQVSHKKFVELVYDGYEKDVNAFVEGVYAPYYIGESLRSRSGQVLLKALQQAAQSDATAEQKSDALEIAGDWLTEAHNRVEGMRAELLAPLKAQRKQINADLDAAYSRVLKANAAVTGYVASIAKVTDLQNQLLDELGIPNVSSRVGDAALQVSSALDKALPAATAKTAEAEKRIKDLADGKKKLQEKLKSWSSKDNP